jgi:hypothetical protein
MKKVKTVYKDTFCSRSEGDYCSNNELAIAQWIDGSITKFPPIKQIPKSDTISKSF